MTDVAVGACTPGIRPVAAPSGASALEAQRSVRYDALLELIDRLQRSDSVDELARLATTRWKHCANVSHWRLLAVFDRQCVCLAALGQQCAVTRLDLADLSPFDAELWQRRRPRSWDAAALAAERGRLPDELALPSAQGLSTWTMQRGTETLGLLSMLAVSQPFDALDRKFIQLVGGALTARIVALLAEQSLRAERLHAERRAMEQRQAAILARLVNGVAHELNTPLGVQLSACGVLSEVLAQPAPDHATLEDAAEALKLIESQVRRSGRIVRRIRQISAAAQVHEPQSTDLACELRLIAGNHTELDVTVDAPSAAVIDIDRTALATVVDELLYNVKAHATPVGALGQASITLVREPAGWCIRVLDHGPGLDAVQAERLFEPFQGSKQSQGHIGIGGFIANNVAKEALGARLELESAPGRTCVFVYLPDAPVRGAVA